MDMMNTTSSGFWMYSLAVAAGTEAELPDFPQESGQPEFAVAADDGASSSSLEALPRDVTAGRPFGRSAARFAADASALEELAGPILTREGKDSAECNRQLTASGSSPLGNVGRRDGSDEHGLQCASKGDRSNVVREAIQVLRTDLRATEAAGKEEEVAYLRSRDAIAALLRVLRVGEREYDDAAAERAFVLRELLPIAHRVYEEIAALKNPARFFLRGWFGIQELLPRYQVSELFPLLTEFPPPFQRDVLSMVLRGPVTSHAPRELEAFLGRPEVFEHLLFQIPAFMTEDRPIVSCIDGETLPSVLLKRIVKTDFALRFPALWKALGAASLASSRMALAVIEAYLMSDHNNAQPFVRGMASAIRSGAISLPAALATLDRIRKGMSVEAIAPLSFDGDPLVSSLAARALVVCGNTKKLADVVKGWIRRGAWERAFETINAATVFSQGEEGTVSRLKPREIVLFVSVVERMLASDKPRLRSSALTLLLRIAPERAEEALVAAARDSDAAVRRRAEALSAALPPSRDQAAEDEERDDGDPLPE